MIGRRLAHYEITGRLGSGGMGDVFRARDTLLKRDVAIKVLGDSVAHDAERLARLQREAELLAALNHPHIAQIHGIERSDGALALVMELVEGSTLAERIARGRIPIDEALAIAKQIAEALEAAHEQNIVHRDLKPANVKVRDDGTVKVLDFGLAKAIEPPAAEVSATLSMQATQPGIILGTAAYMAPEQASGKAVDRRADIWAFGCVLYEMLAGSRAFEGENVSEILGAVLKSEPDWTRLPTDVPRDVRKLLRVCLEKNPARRRESAHDLRVDLDQVQHEADGVASPTAPARMAKWGWIAAVMLALAMLVVSIVHFTATPPPAPEMRVDIATPSTSAAMEFALSPDGRRIVFVASGGGAQRLWLRSLDKTEAQPLAGTEGADFPFWSPDSRSIGFFATGKLRRVDASGGSHQVIADAPAGRGGTWNPGGTILFAPSASGPLARVAATGGAAAPVTRLDPPRQTSHRFPQFLHDGRHFVFYAQGTPEAAGVYLGSLDGGEARRLADADTAAAPLSADTIAFVHGTALLAHHLDLKSGVLTGDPVIVVDPVGSRAGVNLGGFSAAPDGPIAYRSETAGASQLTWVDRAGKTLGTAGEPDTNGLLNTELSPDGRRVAVRRTIQSNMDIWLIDLERGGITRFTFDPTFETTPVWAPDGQRIAFSSNRKGPFNLYLKPASGAGTEELLLETPHLKGPQDWSKDGRFLLYSELGKTGRDLWALPLVGTDKKPIAIATTAFEEANGQFSPDGRWVAYETNESGRFEIVVQPFPDPTARWPVSTSGGTQPRWGADGKELYFIAPDGNLMASSITSGGTFAAAPPAALFPTRLVGGAGANKQQYAVAKDGRFLLNQVLETSAAPITLILNWKSSAK